MDVLQSTDMFSPPINRAMRSLDRSFFQKKINLKAARVSDVKRIGSLRTELTRSKDVLVAERISPIVADPDKERAELGQKCLLLRPELRFEGQGGSIPPSGDVRHASHQATSTPTPWPHSAILSQMIEQGLVSIIPYELSLDYSYWTYHEIISAILPEDDLSELPTGFANVGHISHLNLRDAYLPYKHLIAEIIMDKNPNTRTVINKIDDVGEESEYRTFRYEVLAGRDYMLTVTSEQNCTFRFDYSKVYWNTRLSTEHARMVGLFQEGDAVCDLMAGVGPFAVPAGKKNVFVWANDLNPYGYEYLRDAISLNKVHPFVRAFNEDARTFVPQAVAELLNTDYSVKRRPKLSRSEKLAADAQPRSRSPPGTRTITQPRTFKHFILNLPASALSFLPSFIGIYPPELRRRLPPDAPMPIIHVYCFSTKDERSEDPDESAELKICSEISEQLGVKMEPGIIEEGKVEIHDVRNVAPRKRIYRASFQLPEEVAFRNPVS